MAVVLFNELPANGTVDYNLGLYKIQTGGLNTIPGFSYATMQLWVGGVQIGDDWTIGSGFTSAVWAPAFTRGSLFTPNTTYSYYVTYWPSTSDGTPTGASANTATWTVKTANWAKTTPADDVYGNTWEWSDAGIAISQGGNDPQYRVVCNWVDPVYGASTQTFSQWPAKTIDQTSFLNTLRLAGVEEVTWRVDTNVPVTQNGSYLLYTDPNTWTVPTVSGPPAKATNPDFADEDNSIGNGIELNNPLSWTDPGAGTETAALTFDVLFGTDFGFPGTAVKVAEDVVVGSQYWYIPENISTILGKIPQKWLNAAQGYKWRVDSKNAAGTTTGDTWDFTTTLTLGLSGARNPTPITTATGQSVTINSFTWEGCEGSTTNTVYMGPLSIHHHTSFLTAGQPIGVSTRLGPGLVEHR
jgi:hypothetical protein